MKIDIAPTRAECGRRAAELGAEMIRQAISRAGSARVILATGASQFEMLAELVKADVDWPKVTCFHLDEYVGMSDTHAASFRKYLRERFVERLPRPVAAFHYINGEGDLTAECRRLGELIAARPIDVAFIGIGENGHLAFNDPPADFQTPQPYIVVDLNEACRKQQLGEGWFATLEDVPRQAVSMSIRQIMAARAIICTVPDSRKAPAVRAAMENPITPQTPASILRKHAACSLFLDSDSAALLHR
jgi:glucosamine-6-phosphate deaminase